MRRLPASLLLALALTASPVLGDYRPPPPPPSPSPSSSSSDSPSSESEEPTPRQQAERYFSDAYDNVAKAAKDSENGKQSNALKKYRRALERCRDAVALDSTYHEAWNLIGFTSRKLGDYPHSFEAYRVALRLKPDFALAHEYYGEGLLETGDLAGAKQQLEALRRVGTPELIAELQSAIAKYEAAHPDSSATAGAAHAGSTSPASVAPHDSTAATVSGK